MQEVRLAHVCGILIEAAVTVLEGQLNCTTTVFISHCHCNGHGHSDGRTCSLPALVKLRRLCYTSVTVTVTDTVTVTVTSCSHKILSRVHPGILCEGGLALVVHFPSLDVAKINIP